MLYWLIHCKCCECLWATYPLDLLLSCPTHDIKWSWDDTSACVVQPTVQNLGKTPDTNRLYLWSDTPRCVKTCHNNLSLVVSSKLNKTVDVTTSFEICCGMSVVTTRSLVCFKPQHIIKSHTQLPLPRIIDECAQHLFEFLTHRQSSPLHPSHPQTTGGCVPRRHWQMSAALLCLSHHQGLLAMPYTSTTSRCAASTSWPLSWPLSLPLSLLYSRCPCCLLKASLWCRGLRWCRVAAYLPVMVPWF